MLWWFCRISIKFRVNYSFICNMSARTCVPFLSCIFHTNFNCHFCYLLTTQLPHCIFNFINYIYLAVLQRFACKSLKLHELQLFRAYHKTFTHIWQLMIFHVAKLWIFIATRNWSAFAHCVLLWTDSAYEWYYVWSYLVKARL